MKHQLTIVFANVQTKAKIISIILSILVMGCGTTSKMVSPSPIGEKNKDVLILSILIQNHFQQTNERAVNLNELIQTDTLKRISNSFEKIELEHHGGYISVSYKFSKSRDNSKIELTKKEREMLNWMKWTDKRTSEYDGEIRFDYGERFYHIKKNIVKKEEE